MKEPIVTRGTGYAGCRPINRDAGIGGRRRNHSPRGACLCRRPGVRDLRFRHLRILRSRHRSCVLPVHRSRGLAARQLRDLCRRLSVSSGRRHRHRLLRRPLWAPQGAGRHRRDDGLRDWNHRAHSLLRRDRALGANSAGAVPHVPGLLHRRRVGRRRGVSGRACTSGTPRPDRQFPAGRDRDRRHGGDVLGSHPELIAQSRQLLHLGLAGAVPDRLRARPDRLLSAHARRRDARVSARGRDADHHAHADHGGDPHARRHVRRGVRAVDHRLRDQLRVPGVPAELRIADAEDRSQPRAVVDGACRDVCTWF